MVSTPSYRAAKVALDSSQLFYGGVDLHPSWGSTPARGTESY